MNRIIATLLKAELQPLYAQSKPYFRLSGRIERPSPVPEMESSERLDFGPLLELLQAQNVETLEFYMEMDRCAASRLPAAQRVRREVPTSSNIHEYRVILKTQEPPPEIEVWYRVHAGDVLPASGK